MASRDPLSGRFGCIRKVGGSPVSDLRAFELDENHWWSPSIDALRLLRVAMNLSPVCGVIGIL